MADTVAVLRDPRTIRARAREVLAIARRGEAKCFAVEDGKLNDAIERVVAITRATYPDLRVPIHGRYRHFEAGGVDRLAQLRQRLARDSAIDRAARLWELTVVSVLLDAGAGATWKFQEIETGQAIGRSEGLAVATLRAFERGLFSRDTSDPLRVSSRALAACTPATLGEVFAVSESNPLVGLDGRAALMRRLGEVLLAAGKQLGDTLRSIVSAHGGGIRASELFSYVLADTASIWPPRLSLEGQPLGDVWPLAVLGERLMPFHKLTQWLTYSLVEPLGEAGVRVTALDELTGLPEYRNGGLLLDVGVLVPKSSHFLGQRHRVERPEIIELRALTVALLDEIADGVRVSLGKSSEELPLAAVLQGGTWSAGRAIAAEKRPGGPPPFDVDSDGTVF